MAAATILSGPSEPHVPGMEVVQLECSDGETYTSQRFKTVTKVLPGGNEDVDAHINAVVTSGNVITVNYAGQTDKKVTLLIFGLY